MKVHSDKGTFTITGTSCTYEKLSKNPLATQVNRVFKSLTENGQLNAKDGSYSKDQINKILKECNVASSYFDDVKTNMNAIRKAYGLNSIKSTSKKDTTIIHLEDNK